jgi:hypothetical protein
MCELVGQVTSADSDAEFACTAVLTKQFILNYVYGCLEQGLVVLNKAPRARQNCDLVKEVLLVVPTLEEA